MDHPLVLDVVRPWRTTAIVASVIALGELVVLVVVGLALLGGPLSRQAERAVTERVAPPAAKPQPRVEVPAPAAPTLERGETSVLVLNGNGRSRAAADTAESVRARGYVVGGTGNANRSDYPRSLVMYRAGFEGEAHRLARDLGVKVVGPLDGMAPGDLLGAHLALVIGAK
jgi:hypothetical protein